MWPHLHKYGSREGSRHAVAPAKFIYATTIIPQFK